MKLALNLKRNKFLVVYSLVILILLALMAIFHVTFNFTPSMPIGFYYRVENPGVLKAGDDVEVCLPKEIGEKGLKRGYIKEGSCPGGFEPLVKELIAVPGDSVALTKAGMKVNGTDYYDAPFIQYDIFGNKMHAYPIKHMTHTTKYWLYGANDPKYSWDSRFYGGVDKQNIKGIVKPLLTSETFAHWF